MGVPNPGNPAQVASLGAPQPNPRQAAATIASTNVPNPGNPAQQEINQTPQQQRNGLGAGLVNGAQQVGATATTAPAPVTVDPRDAPYYEQLARLNAARQGALNGYDLTKQQNQAAYNQTYGQLSQQLPLTQQNTRNQANGQGLLESGILGQRADLNNAAYLGRVGAAQARQTSADQNAAARRDAVLNAYDPTAAGYLATATARAAAADLAGGATTPKGPRPYLRSRAIKGAAPGGAVAGLAPHPAQRTHIPTPGPVAHTTLGLNGTPTGRALAGSAQRAINLFGVGGNLRRQAARKVVQGGG